jgi:hypothetical protein
MSFGPFFCGFSWLAADAPGFFASPLPALPCGDAEPVHPAAYLSVEVPWTASGFAASL